MFCYNDRQKNLSNRQRMKFFCLFFPFQLLTEEPKDSKTIQYFSCLNPYKIWSTNLTVLIRVSQEGLNLFFC